MLTGKESMQYFDDTLDLQNLKNIQKLKKKLHNHVRASSNLKDFGENLPKLSVDFSKYHSRNKIGKSCTKLRST